MGSTGYPWGGGGADQPPRGGGSNPKLSKRVSETFERTKEVASTGVEKTKFAAAAAAKKVKEGASVGVNWIKLKYNKSKLFQKK